MKQQTTSFSIWKKINYQEYHLVFQGNIQGLDFAFVATYFIYEKTGIKLIPGIRPVN